jgi:CRISPR-associated protein Cas8a1/Csx13
MTELTLSIYDPNTLLPHRAGIAGLALALSSMSKDEAPLTWEITEDQVRLTWACTDKEAVQWLVGNTYEIRDGLLTAPCLELSQQNFYPFSRGILGTFLQFSSGNKEFDKSEKTLAFAIEDSEYIVKYRQLLWCYYTQIEKISAFTATGYFQSKINVSSKHLPGLIQDFVNGNYRESPTGFISLLFLPLACSYFQLPFVPHPDAKKKTKVPTYAIVMPEVINLLGWSKRRKELAARINHNFRSDGAGASALQVLLQEKLLEDLKIFRVKYCEVYKIGPQQWDTSQMGLKQAVYRIEVTDEILQVYESATQFFPPQVKTNDKNEPWLAVSKTLPWICDNLIIDKPWYSGFYEFRKRNVLYERIGLVKMTTNYLNDRERILFDAVQGAFKKYRGKQIQQANNQGRPPDWEQITNKVIYRLQRPSTQQEFASALVDFLSQFRSKSASGMGAEIYTWIHGESQWKQARDLTLLAVATYQSKKGDAVDGEDVSLESSPEIEPEEDASEDI